MLKTFKIYTLGCKVNRWDSGELMRRLIGIGLSEVERDADVVIVNSCAVTKAALRKDRKMIARARRDNPAAMVVLIGCWPAVYSADGLDSGADKVLARREFEDLEGLIFRHSSCSAIQTEHPPLSKRDVKPAGSSASGDHVRGNFKIVNRGRYFLKIQDGCEQYCSYCVIPYARGKYQSRPVKDIIIEAEAAVSAGCGEIVLCGIHLGKWGVEQSVIGERVIRERGEDNSFQEVGSGKWGVESGKGGYGMGERGKDKGELGIGNWGVGSGEQGVGSRDPAISGFGICRHPGVDRGDPDVRVGFMDSRWRGNDTRENDLPVLTKRLLEIKGSFRVRLSSIEINEVDDELVGLMAENRQFCRHLHVPLQAGCDKILKLMNRPYDTAGFIERVESIRRLVPDIALTTDVIVGFPGETDDDFTETCEYIRRIGFSRLHVFPYSEHEKAPARLLPGKVSERVILERARRLRKLNGELMRDYRSMFTGKVEEVVIERKISRNSFFGTGEHYLEVEFNADQIEGGEAGIGGIARVRILTIKKPRREKRGF